MPCSFTDLNLNFTDSLNVMIFANPVSKSLYKRVFEKHTQIWKIDATSYINLNAG